MSIASAILVLVLSGLEKCFLENTLATIGKAESSFK